MFTKFLSLSALAASIVTASFFTSCADDIPEPVIPAASASAESVELDVVADTSANPASRSAELSYAVFDSEGEIVLTSGDKDAPDPVETPDGWHLSLPVRDDGRYSVVFIGADSPCDIKAQLLSGRSGDAAKGANDLLANLTDADVWAATVEIAHAAVSSRTVKLVYRPNARKTCKKPSTRFAGTLVEGSIPADWLWRIDGELFCIGADYGDTSFDYELEKTASKSYKLAGASVKTIDVFPSTEQLTDMSEMFSGCKKLSRIPLKGFETHNVTTMCNMFKDCHSLESLNLSGFDTRNVTDMSYMFSENSSVKELDLSSFDTRKVISMKGMFSGCTGLTSLNLSNFAPQSIDDMSYMFEGCSNLVSLDLSNLDIATLAGAQDMFKGCTSLTHIRCTGAFMNWAMVNAFYNGLPKQMNDVDAHWEIVD